MPPELDQAVLACLAKRPADRPQSAMELSRMLADACPEPWSAGHAIEWWDRHLPRSLTPVRASRIVTLSAGNP